MIDINVHSREDLNELLDFIIDNKIMSSVVPMARERKASRKGSKVRMLKDLRSRYAELLDKPTDLERDILLMLRTGWVLVRRCFDRKRRPYKWLVVEPKTGKYCAVTHQEVKSRNVQWRVSNNCCVERKDLHREDVEFAFSCGGSYFSGKDSL